MDIWLGDVAYLHLRRAEQDFIVVGNTLDSSESECEQLVQR
jgi:hypothetical protein